MIFHEFGKEGEKTVLLIHGLGCNAERSFAIPSAILSRTYRVIAVDLDGYDGNDSVFTTISDQAEKIAVFLRKHCDGRLHACLGMSMGGLIAMELICRHDILSDGLILDSGYIPPFPFPRLFSRLTANAFTQILRGNPTFFTKRAMESLMAYDFQKEQLCPDASWKTIFNIQYSNMTWKIPDNLEILNHSSTVFFHGSKEKTIIKGAHILKERLPEMRIVCTGDYGHGELMFTDPQRYTELIVKEMSGI